MIRVTSGPLFGGSSPSDDLQLFLGNRLRQRMAGRGLGEYALTWKSWDIESGPPICALRASVLRTSGKGCTGWPTPNAIPKSRGGLQKNPEKALERKAQGHMMNLDDVATIAGWVTPSSRDWKDTPGMSQTGTNPDGSNRKRLDQLPRQAAIAGWRTPTAGDGDHGGPNARDKSGNPHLSGQAAIAGWPTPRAVEIEETPERFFERMRNSKHKKNQGKTRPGNVAIAAQLASGTTPNTSPAQTEKRGALNPALSAWLMGFPEGWGSYADTAIRSSRK